MKQKKISSLLSYKEPVKILADFHGVSNVVLWATCFHTDTPRRFEARRSSQLMQIQLPNTAVSLYDSVTTLICGSPGPLPQRMVLTHLLSAVSSAKTSNSSAKARPLSLKQD